MSPLPEREGEEERKEGLGPKNHREQQLVSQLKPALTHTHARVCVEAVKF